ncbi:glutamate-cysteine ligase family protein [Haladaptatus sp. CMSO5]|uniref:glutamate-cysteine ligase family protein n=1 Tax=Haladaptatus sp. CMSO5 TaxID=3120514 RepID=UPI003FA5F6CF
MAKSSPTTGGRRTRWRSRRVRQIPVRTGKIPSTRSQRRPVQSLTRAAQMHGVRPRRRADRWQHRRPPRGRVVC